MPVNHIMHTSSVHRPISCWFRRSTSCRLSWVSTILLGFCCFLLIFPQGSWGMIRIVDTGKRYASRQDKHYGPSLRKGYEYHARLQLLYNNMHLCPSYDDNNKNRTYEVVQPRDGLPVALLVRPGGCTFQEKIQFLKDSVKPARLVQYLIFDSSTYTDLYSLSNAAAVENHGAVAATEQQRWLRLNNGDQYRTTNNVTDTEEEDEADKIINDVLFWDGLNEASPNVFELSSAEQRESLLKSSFYAKEKESFDSFLTRRKYPYSRDSVHVPQYVLHISPRSAHTLLQLLYTYGTESEGVYITMDSRIGTTIINQSTALWIACSALLGACCCSFLLIVCGARNGWWDVVVGPEPPTAQQPTRPQRRRLTKEQVRRLFPIYTFNGESLEAMEETCLLAGAEAAHQGESEGNNEDVLLGHSFVPRPLELSLCSICLDEYEPGDRLRCLDPCHHAFHAKCIGRWLSERSATCPLCKMELYDPEEEEDDEDNEDEEQAQGNTGSTEQQQEQTADNQSTDHRPRFFFSFNPLGRSNNREEETAALVTSPPMDGGEPVATDAAQQQPTGTSPTPSATLELDDNASSVVEHFRRRPWWRRVRGWFSSSSSDRSNPTTDLENTTLTLGQPLLGGEINHPNSVVDGGNLMMPLESTLVSSSSSQAGENNNHLNNDSLFHHPAHSSLLPTAANGGGRAGIGNDEELARSALSGLQGEDSSPDPPGPHANSHEFAVV